MGLERSREFVAGKTMVAEAPRSFIDKIRQFLRI
jgi:hypothetical protein